MPNSSIALAACVPTALLFLAPPSAGQVFERRARGAFSSHALAVVTEGNGLEGQLRLKSPGDATQEPFQWSARNIPWQPCPGPEPDFSLAAMFGDLDATERADLEFDALSTGAEDLPTVDTDGVFDTSGRWLMMNFSVKDPSESGAQAGVPGSLIREASVGGRDLGGDVFGAYWPSSNGFAQDLVNTVQLEQAGSHLGLTSAEQISALDFGLGVRWHAPAQVDHLFPVGAQIYLVFSLTPGSAGLMPADFANDGGTAVPAHAGDLYLLTWSSTGAGGAYEWSGPDVWFSSAELGGTVDVDAVTANVDQETVVYSTALGETGSQLRVIQRAATNIPAVGPTDLKLDGDTLAADWVGLRDGPNGDFLDSDDIASACVIDPELMGGGTAHRSSLAGTPVARFDPFPLWLGKGICGFSVTRMDGPASGAACSNCDDDYFLQTTLPGDTSGGVLAYYVTNQPGAGQIGWLLMGSANLSAGQFTHEFRYPTANVLALIPTMQEFAFGAVYLDSVTATLHLGHEQRILTP